MFDTTQVPKEALYLLADHLDAALAAGEDLLASRLEAIADMDATDGGAEDALTQFVGRLERLEASFLGRVLHARRRLDEIPRNDVELKPVSNLFFSSTALLLELVSRFKTQAENQFDAGGDRLPFLRERGLLARDAPGLPQYAPVIVTDAYRVGGVLELGPLMDMVAGLLDLLDRRYELYAGAEVQTLTADETSRHGPTGGLLRDNTFGSNTEEGVPAAHAERTSSRRMGTLDRYISPLANEATHFDASRLTPASLMEALREIEQPSATSRKPMPPLQ